MENREFILKYFPQGKAIGRHYKTQCLWCLKNEMVIDLETGKFCCNRKNNCGVTGNIKTLKKKLGLVDKFICHHKSHFKPIKKDIVQTHSEIKFFKNRGINESVVRWFKVFIGKYNEKPALCFPYYYKNQLANIKYRMKDKKFAQEKNNYSTLWNIDNVDSGKPLYIVEGEIDAMSMYQFGFQNVVSVPSGVSNLNWIANNFDELEEFENIFLCLDNDKAGDDAVDVISKRLGRHRCKRLKFKGYKDANEALMAGWEGRTADIIRVHDLKPELLVKPNDFIEKAIRRKNNPDYSQGDESAFQLRYKTNKFHGFFRQAVTIWSGVQGHGKTTLILQEMVHQIINNNRNICIASLEQSVEALLFKITKQIIADEYTDDEFMTIANYLNEKIVFIDFIGTINRDVLLEHFSYSAMKFGTNHFVIDNLMKINLSTRDGFKDYKDFINELTGFARKHDCHVHLVAHQRKCENSTKTVLPSVHGILGSSELANAVDNVLLVHRINEDDNIDYPVQDRNQIIHVGKQRVSGDCFSNYFYYYPKSETFHKEDNADLTKYIKKIFNTELK